MKPILFTAALLLVAAAPAQADPTYAGWSGATASAGGNTGGGAGQFEINVTGGNINVQAAASGSLRDGKVHAMAWSSNDPVLSSYCAPWLLWCNWGTNASVALWDVVTMSAPAGSGGRELKYSFSGDGQQTKGRWWSGSHAYAYYYFGVYDGTSPHMVALGAENKISGSLWIPDGGSLPVYFYASLDVGAEGGAVSDYSNTLKFDWDLPSDVTFTSASGEFMADRLEAPAGHLPEPASLALTGAGLLAALRVRRRGR